MDIEEVSKNIDKMSNWIIYNICIEFESVIFAKVQTYNFLIYSIVRFRQLIFMDPQSKNHQQNHSLFKLYAVPC